MQDFQPSSPPPDSATEALKTPPHSQEAEQSVLGGLMLSNDQWIHIADKLTEKHFYRLEHQLIFRALKTLCEQGHPCDVLTLANWLNQQGKLETIGGIPYLGTLVRNTPSVANIVAYAEIVRERAMLRRLIHIGQEVAQQGFNPQGRTSKELLEIAEKSLFDLNEENLHRNGAFVSIKDILPATLDKIDYLHQTGSDITGIPTGFSDFDKMTCGLQRSDLIIVAGRPSMGKTTFAMNIAENVAIKNKTPVAVFSMEMPSEQLAMRLISSLSNINQQSVRTGKLNDEDWPCIISAMSLLSEAPLYIDDSPALNPTEVRARLRRLNREVGQLSLVVIDYLQLMQVPDSRENRATEVGEISRALKALAKELSVPVLALSQLNRGLEQRPNKRPVMSDLRESGSIEQDADLIAFIYRDEVYNEDSPDKGTAEIIIGKQRNGPTGIVRLAFEGSITKFRNYAPEAYVQYY